MSGHGDGVCLGDFCYPLACVTWTGERAGNGGWAIWGGHDGWGCVVYSSIGGGGELGTKGVRGWNLLG